MMMIPEDVRVEAKAFLARVVARQVEMMNEQLGEGFPVLDVPMAEEMKPAFLHLIAETLGEELAKHEMKSDPKNFVMFFDGTLTGMAETLDLPSDCCAAAQGVFRAAYERRRRELTILRHGGELI